MGFQFGQPHPSECERESEGGEGVSERESPREGGSEFPRERERASGTFLSNNKAPDGSPFFVFFSYSSTYFC